MQKFKATSGKEFIADVNLGTMKGALNATGVNLYLPESLAPDGQFPLSTALQGLDLMLSANVLYRVCKKSADALEIDEEQFMEELDGETMSAGMTAFRADWRTFLQRMGKASAVKQLDAAEAMIASGMKRVIQIVDEAILDFETKFSVSLASVGGKGQD